LPLPRRLNPQRLKRLLHSEINCRGKSWWIRESAGGKWANKWLGRPAEAKPRPDLLRQFH
jgi:hypothetical protein